MTKWQKYLDEDYEDDLPKVERIPHRPKRNEDDKVKPIKKDKPNRQFPEK